ncbi:MAG: hypothetical protein K6E18_06380 [Lachnospiraceae bacterium]|nr:hypothetical protein [Lachnospiraceae bacterium]
MFCRKMRLLFLLALLVLLPSEKLKAEVPTPYFGEYQYCDEKYSTSFIDLHICIEDSNTADGIEIYRKQGKGAFQLITTIPVKQGEESYSYRDKNVRYAKTYTYKLRCFKTLNGQKSFSDFSSPFDRTAANRWAKYKIRKINYSPEGITVSLKNMKNNGKLVIDKKGLSDITFESGSGEGITLVELGLKAYSYDGVHWKNLGKKCTLKAKDSKALYLRFVPIDEDYDLPAALPSDATIMMNHVEYNSLWYTWMKLNLSAKRAHTGLDLEYYH